MNGSAGPARPRARRALLLAAAVLATTASLAPAPAQAAPPERTSLPAAETLTGNYCDFPVTLTTSGGDGTALTFASGRQVLTFASDTVARLTGPTGRSTTVRIKGPGTFSASPPTFTLLGWTLLYGLEGDPRVLSGTGRTVLDLETGVILSRTGHFVDLCPRVAP